MMAETKNVMKAASLAADSVGTVFYRKEKIRHPELAFYFRDNTIGQIFYHTININEEVALWGTSEWENFIRQGITSYLEHSKLIPDELVSVVVSFKLGKLPKSLYTVENTDLSRIDSYDHFMVTNAVSGKSYETWFTPEQRAEIHSVFDALDLVERMGPDKLKPRKEQSELPWICLHGNKE